MTTMLSNKEMFDSIVLKLKTRRVRTILIGLYVLFILGLSATVKAAEMRFLPVTAEQMHTSTFRGTAFLSADGQHMLLEVADNKVYELRSENLDLSQIDGLPVRVTGFEYKHRVGPVYQLSSFTPPSKNGDDQLAVAPVVFVLNIEVLQQK